MQKGDSDTKKQFLRLLACALLACIVFAACACVSADNRTVRAEPCVFEDTSRENSNVVVRYPRFISAEGGFDEINRQVEEKAKSFAEDVYLQDYVNLDLSLEYAYSVSEKYVSVAFEGIGNVSTAAHPNNHYETIVFSREGQSIVTLSDMYEVDDALTSAFMKHLQETGDGAADYFNETYDAASLLSKCDNGSSECYSYITDTELTISFSVPHALGDYVKVTIPLEELQ